MSSLDTNTTGAKDEPERESQAESESGSVDNAVRDPSRESQAEGASGSVNNAIRDPSRESQTKGASGSVANAEFIRDPSQELQAEATSGSFRQTTRKSQPSSAQSSRSGSSRRLDKPCSGPIIDGAISPVESRQQSRGHSESTDTESSSDPEVMEILYEVVTLDFDNHDKGNPHSVGSQVDEISPKSQEDETEDI